MAIDTTSPRTRRAILLGAIGGAVAAAAASVGRANLVSATNEEPVLVGHTYSATTVTEIDATGATAISGTSNSAIGVHGTSTANVGVLGSSSSGSAVAAQSFASHKPAMLALSSGNSTAVQGYSGTDSQPAAPASTGVHGYADQSAAAVGVLGQTTAGRGVVGRATTGIGVHGKSDSGRGGQFSGGKAQVRLIPSSAATHPTAGAPGDLFVDKSARLWFCKKGGNPATWKQVSLA